jgi:translation initiation factor 2 alpha subunit (eIF-2alpha)
MKFHNNSRPEMDEVTMCTVISYNEQTGFNVMLDEYDLEGLVALVDLNSKKIRGPVSSFLKTGEQMPLLVIDPGVDGIVYLSKKDVKPQKAKICSDRYALSCKLFNVAKRLPEHLEFTETFRYLNSRPDPDDDLDLDPNIVEDHPWVLLQNREWERLSMTDEQIQAIEDMHSKIFGIKPRSIRFKFTLYSFACEGNAVVRDHLLHILETWSRPIAASDNTTNATNATNAPTEWSDEELYQDTSRCNLSIQPIAIPTFQAKITAYNLERCHEALETLKTQLQQTGLDGVVLGETC